MVLRQDNPQGCPLANIGSTIAGHAGTVANAITLGVQSIFHGAAGGLQAIMNGGRFVHGFLAAGFTKAFSPAIGYAGAAADGGNFGNMMEFSAAAMVGGTASRIAGGSFESGAVIGFFSRAFNDALHEDDDYSGPVYDSLRRFRDWITAPTHWWNDPNSPLTQTTDLGEIMKKSVCVTSCMARNGAPIASESLIWEMFAIGLVEAGVGPIPVAFYETLSNTGTTSAILEATARCLTKECSCENN